jgi:hypothetical protein
MITAKAAADLANKAIEQIDETALEQRLEAIDKNVREAASKGDFGCKIPFDGSVYPPPFAKRLIDRLVGAGYTVRWENKVLSLQWRNS